MKTPAGCRGTERGTGDVGEIAEDAVHAERRELQVLLAWIAAIARRQKHWLAAKRPDVYEQPGLVRVVHERRRAGEGAVGVGGDDQPGVGADAVGIARNLGKPAIDRPVFSAVTT